MVERLCEALRGHATIRVACHLAGIHQDTFYATLERASRPGAKKCDADFAEAITHAQADAEASIVRRIESWRNNKGEDDWRALAWIAERRYSKDWANRHQLAVIDETARDEVRREMLEHVRKHLGDEQWRKLLQAMAEAK